jgi:hypothetical protein
VKTFLSLVAPWLVFAVVAPVAAQTTVGWPDTIDLLTQARSQAETCAELLKSNGDKATITAGRIAYNAAKAKADGVIAGFTVALVEGGKPEDLPKIEANLEKAGAGLQEVCDAAVKSATSAPGTKGVVEEMSDRWWTRSSLRPAPCGRGMSRKTSSNWRPSRPNLPLRNGRTSEAGAERRIDGKRRTFPRWSSFSSVGEIAVRPSTRAVAIPSSKNFAPLIVDKFESDGLRRPLDLKGFPDRSGHVGSTDFALVHYAELAILREEQELKPVLRSRSLRDGALRLAHLAFVRNRVALARGRRLEGGGEEGVRGHPGAGVDASRVAGPARNRQRDAVPLSRLRDRVDLALPSAGLRVSRDAKLTDERFRLRLYPFRSFAAAAQPPKHFRPLCRWRLALHSRLYAQSLQPSAVRHLFAARRDRAGNLPLFPSVYPDQLAPAVRRGA